MGLIDLASNNSLWRGYDYFERKNVLSYKKVTDTESEGKVKGTAIYDVYINVDHPRKSKCNCPHADGRRVICKHMIALYFTVYPEEAQKFMDEVKAYEEEQEEIEQEQERIIKERYKEIKEYVYSLSKSELREKLIDEMMDEVYESLEDFDDYRW